MLKLWSWQNNKNKSSAMANHHVSPFLAHHITTRPRRAMSSFTTLISAHPLLPPSRLALSAHLTFFCTPLTFRLGPMEMFPYARPPFLSKPAVVVRTFKRRPTDIIQVVKKTSYVLSTQPQPPGRSPGRLRSTPDAAGDPPASPVGVSRSTRRAMRALRRRRG